MNIILAVLIALIALLSGTAQAASEESASAEVRLTTYVVKKGDTLTAITAKKFPKATVAAVAKQNNIANPDLIYPGTVLSFPADNSAAADTAAEMNVVTKRNVAEARVRIPVLAEFPLSEKSTAKTVCNAAPIIARLDYPHEVKRQLEALTSQHSNTKNGSPFRGVVMHGDNEFHLLLDEHCIATKIVDRPNTVSGTEHTHENTAALTPRQRVPSATSDTTGLMSRFNDAEMEVFLARIKNELQTIMGPGEDVSPLVIPIALAVLHKGETGEAISLLLKKPGGNR